MAASILDGAALARQIREELKPRVEAFAAAQGRPPGPGIVLVGDDPGSEIYVRNKLKSAGETGLRADLERLPADSPLQAVLDGYDFSQHLGADVGVPFKIVSIEDAFERLRASGYM